MSTLMIYDVVPGGFNTIDQQIDYVATKLSAQLASQATNQVFSKEEFVKLINNMLKYKNAKIEYYADTISNKYHRLSFTITRFRLEYCAGGRNAHTYINHVVMRLINSDGSHSNTEKYINSLDEIIDTIDTNIKLILANKIKRNPTVTVANLPEPYKFGDVVRHIKINDSSPSVCGVASNAVISRIFEINIVAINDDCTVDDSEISTPGKDVWFRLQCMGSAGATFDIISDGNGWYPITRYKKNRITMSMKPKKSVDLSYMSTVDKTLINEAIKLYLEGNWGRDDGK